VTQSYDLEGCASSLGYGGRLRAIGVASVSSDSLVLLGSQMPNSSALYFQVQATSCSCPGTTFGDGTRCAAGIVTRLGTTMNASGASGYPESGDPPVSVAGAIPPMGGARYYQVWYRNAASFCTSATFNLSNGYSVYWQP
jgi:hypothetical protein